MTWQLASFFVSLLIVLMVYSSVVMTGNPSSLAPQTPNPYGLISLSFFALCHKYGLKRFGELVPMDRLEKILREGYNIGKHEDFSRGGPVLLLELFDADLKKSG